MQPEVDERNAVDVVTSDLEKGNLNDCLDIIGESPLKFPSKITPTYICSCQNCKSSINP